MRIAVLLALVACSPAEPELAGPDSGHQPPDPNELVWVHTGSYDVAWETGESLECEDGGPAAELGIGSATYEMWFPCTGWVFSGRIVDNCRFYGEDVGLHWHLCPNIGYLAGEHRDADNHVLATFRAYPR